MTALARSLSRTADSRSGSRRFYRERHRATARGRGFMADVEFDRVKALEAEHVLQTYKRAPVAFVRGEGTRLFDASGRSYLDFISGIGVVVLGHGHPALAQAGA